MGQKIGTALHYNNEEALDTVLKNDKAISDAAKRYEIEKEMIQAILFQEVRFYNTLDPVADSFVIQSHLYEAQLEHYEESGKVPFYPLKPPLIYRSDSSTGLGQIFAGTAIEALNWERNKKRWWATKTYDIGNTKDIRFIWEKLQDNDYNIDMIGRVLAYKSTLPGNADIDKTLKSYNGLGDLAEKYMNVTMEYYDAFKKFNSECE